MKNEIYWIEKRNKVNWKMKYSELINDMLNKNEINLIIKNVNLIGRYVNPI